jgi:FG-GAP-like repeat
MAPAPQPPTSPSSTPNPFVPKRAAKEYIYVGGKMQAIEEPKQTVGGTAFDFTGNGSGDVVVWRQSEANWYVLDLSTNSNTLQSLGLPTDIIVPGDYDGDSKTDIAVWRPNTGNCSSNNCGWYVKQSSDGVTQYYADWGQALPSVMPDVTVPADYDGDGRTDRAVWRPMDSNWYIFQSQSQTTRVEGWGQNGDRPVAADYDGDGKADITVFRPSDGNWYVKLSAGGSLIQGWGQSADVLAPADYDGDGRADIAVWRPSEGNWYIRQSSNGTTRRESWGNVGDKIVPADYDGDGRADIAVWRSSDGNWYIRRSSDGSSLVRGWGAPGDRPVAAAYVREP